MTMTKTQQRTRRHKRVRAKVVGSEARPRLSVYKSNTRLLAQIIDDKSGKTLASVTSLGEKGKTPRERAEAAAATLAKRAHEKGIKAVVFDRGGGGAAGTVEKGAERERHQGRRLRSRRVPVSRYYQSVCRRGACCRSHVLKRYQYILYDGR